MTDKTITEATTAAGAVAEGAGEASPSRLDAFVSYSHADRPVAAGIQKGLQRIARRMGRLNALRVFRDDTDLTATPDLFGRLTGAMDASRYLVVVLSPHAAQSEWVNKEVSHWLETRGPEQMLMVLAEGSLAWDEANGCMDSALSDAAVPALTRPGVLPREPLWIDVSADSPWDLRSAAFRDKVTDLAAPIHGKSKYELASDDVREQRRFRRWRRAAIVALALLTAVAVAAAVIAVGQRQEADRQRQSALVAQNRAEKAQKAAEAAQATAEAQRNEAVAQSLAISSREALARNPSVALALAAESYRATPEPTRQALAALADAHDRFDGEAAHQIRDPFATYGGPAEDVRFSPDGRRVAASGDDGAVRIWDASTGRLVRQIQVIDPSTIEPDSTTGEVWIDVTSDWSQLVTVSGDGIGQVWDLQSGNAVGPAFTVDAATVGRRSVVFRPGTRELLYLTGERGRRGSATWFCGASLNVTADGRTLACQGPDGSSLLLVDATSGKLHRTIDVVSSGSTDALAISPDGRRVATAVDFERVGVWDATNGKPIGEPVNVGVGSVTSLAFSKGGTTLAAAGDRGLIRLVDAASGTPMGPAIRGHTDYVNAIAFSGAEDHLASVGVDGSVRLWELSPGAGAERILASGLDEVSSFDVSADGATIASTGAEGSVHQWNVATGEQVGAVAAVKESVHGVAEVGGACLVTKDGSAQCSNKVVKSSAPRGASTIGSAALAYSPDASRLAVLGSDGVLRLRESSTGRLLRATGLGVDEVSTSLDYAPNGQLIAAGGTSGVHLWDGATGARLSTDLLPRESVNSVAFSPDGSVLAAGGQAGTHLWRITAGVIDPWEFLQLPGAVTSVDFSPDGGLLATGGEDDAVRIWDASTGKQIGRPMLGHTGSVEAVAFGPSGTILASSGQDNTLRFWDVTSTQPIGKPWEISPGRTLRFTPDGEWVATGAEVGIGGVRLRHTPWNVDRECERVVPYVTQEMMAQFLPAGWKAKGCALPP